MTNKEKARLLTAYVWDCEHCGAENFARAVVAELCDDHREELYRHFHHLEAWEELPTRWREFEIVTHPDTVTCRSCGMEFEAKCDDEADQGEQ